MNMNDINRLFTAKVTELLAQGYQINPETMGGSQGEMAHVDLTNGSDILRVLIEAHGSCGRCYGDILTIRVGRCTDKIGSWKTIWNNRLEILSEISVAKISEDFYTTIEESERMAQVRHERWRRNHAGEFAQEKKPSSAVLQIALRMVRKMPRMKGCQMKDITKVTRVNKGARGQGGAMAGYNIEAKGKTFFFPVK